MASDGQLVQLAEPGCAHTTGLYTACALSRHVSAAAPCYNAFVL